MGSSLSQACLSSFLVGVCSGLLLIFKHWVVCLLMLSFKSSMYVLGMNPSSDRSSEKIFSLSFDSVSASFLLVQWNGNVGMLGDGNQSEGFTLSLFSSETTQNSCPWYLLKQSAVCQEWTPWWWQISWPGAGTDHLAAGTYPGDFQVPSL